MRDQDLESSRNFSFKCHDACSYPIINVLDVAENLGPVDREAAVNARGKSFLYDQMLGDEKE